MSHVQIKPHELNISTKHILEESQKEYYMVIVGKRSYMNEFLYVKLENTKSRVTWLVTFCYSIHLTELI